MYGAGSGFSGPSVRVEPGFEMGEVASLTQKLSQNTELSPKETEDSFSMSGMSCALESITGEITQSTALKRY